MLAIFTVTATCLVSFSIALSPRHLRHFEQLRIDESRNHALTYSVPLSPTPPPSGLVKVTSLNASWRVDAAEFNGAPYLGVTGTGRPQCREVAYAYSTAAVVDALKSVSSAQRVQVRSGRHSYMSFAAVPTENGPPTQHQHPYVVDVSNISFVGKVRKVMLRAEGAAGGKVRKAEREAFVADVGPGNRLFDLYDKLAHQGYLFPGGSCPTVGTSGFTLGGGYGFWSKAFGLAAQNLVGAELVWRNSTGNVIAENVTLESEKGSEPMLEQRKWDLLWGLRGGGTNSLGAITKMTIEVYPLPSKGVTTTAFSYRNKSTCSAAFALYQQHHQADHHHLASQHHRTEGATIEENLPWTITYQMNLYVHGDCAVSATGFNLTEPELREKVAQWLRLPGATQKATNHYSPGTTGWLQMIQFAGGCGSYAQCKHFAATDYPKPENPLRWGAMTSYLFSTMNPTQTNTMFEAIATGLGDTGFSMAMIDGYGGAIYQKGLNNRSSFASSDALFHFQILSYFDPGQQNLQNSEDWQLAVFDSIDKTQVRHQSYRNYASPLFDRRPPLSAVERYYGTNLPNLRTIREQWDPLGIFNYTQGY